MDGEEWGPGNPAKRALEGAGGEESILCFQGVEYSVLCGLSCVPKIHRLKS